MLRTKLDRRGDAGSAYVIVLLILLLLTIFGLGLVVVTQTERQIGANQRDASRTFYAADSGIAISAGWLLDNNFAAHQIQLSERQAGDLLVIRDLVDTSRVLNTGSRYSNLGDITSVSGNPQVAANFRFDSTARRVAGNIQVAQKRVELMVELDPFDLTAESLYTGDLEYAPPAEEEPSETSP